MSATLNSVTGKDMKKKPEELAVGGKGETLNAKENARMKRKKMLAEALNKIHDPDIA